MSITILIPHIFKLYLVITFSLKIFSKLQFRLLVAYHYKTIQMFQS